MGSLEARMKLMPRISVDTKHEDGEFVVDVMYNNTRIAEILMRVESFEFNIGENEGSVKLMVRNPHWQGKVIIREYVLIKPEE